MNETCDYCGFEKADCEDDGEGAPICGICRDLAEAHEDAECARVIDEILVLVRERAEVE